MSGGPLALLKRLLESRSDRDGQVPALEHFAAEFAIPSAESDAGRRERGFWLPQELLDRALSQKVLDGWLQNRHQVLVPLTFRLGRLSALDLGVLMQFAATVVLIASGAETRDIAGAERWLREVGADDAGVATFHDALAAPPPFSDTLTKVREAGLEPYAYAAAVAVANAREPSGHLFANFIAARLALPADAIRSIDRRFRR